MKNLSPSHLKTILHSKRANLYYLAFNYGEFATIKSLAGLNSYKLSMKAWVTKTGAKEGSQLVTDCNQLKLPAADGKNYLTDVATAETLLRLVQSVPSPKAEPIKKNDGDAK